MAKKRMKRKGARRKAVRRAGRKPMTAAASGNDAASNLHALLGSLHAQRDALDHQIGAIENALAAFAGAAAPRSGRVGRPKKNGGGGSGQYRSGSLKDYVESVLASGAVMAVKDIADAVLAAGFKTKNQTLAKSVGIALTQMPNVEKVGRGKFQLK